MRRKPQHEDGWWPCFWLVRLSGGYWGDAYPRPCLAVIFLSHTEASHLLFSFLSCGPLALLLRALQLQDDLAFMATGTWAVCVILCLFLGPAFAGGAAW